MKSFVIKSRILNRILILLLVSFSISIVKAQTINIPYELSIRTDATNIQWYAANELTGRQFEEIPGEVNDTIEIYEPGLYYANYELGRCFKFSDIFVFIHTNDPFIFPFSLIAATGADNYQWYDGNTRLDSETDNYLEVNEIGEYYVMIEDDLCRVESPRYFVVNPQPPIATDDIYIIPLLPNSPPEISITRNIIPNDEPNYTSYTVNLIPGLSSSTQGTINLQPDGSFTYTVNSNFLGTDTFYYELCNPLGLCDTAMILISIGGNVDCNNFDIDNMFVPQLLTPNGDEKNDEWIINDLLRYRDCYETNEVIIINIWEEKVFHGYNYGLVGGWWGGYSTNNLDYKDAELLPSGTYFYVIYLDGDKKNAINGFIHIQWSE